MRGCSRSKICINYWFIDCWIWKPNFYYGLVDPEWFFNYGFLNLECIFWITDWWIQNDFFQLWIFCIFFIWINTIIHVLPEASIRENTRCTNPKIYRKHQSKNLPDFIIQNTEKNKNVQFILWQFCVCATLWGCRKKNVGVKEETALSYKGLYLITGPVTSFNLSARRIFLSAPP